MGLQDVLEAEGAKGRHCVSLGTRSDGFLGRHVLSPRLAAEDGEDTAGGKCNTDDTQPQSQAGLCPSDAALKDMCWAWHHSQSALGMAALSFNPVGNLGAIHVAQVMPVLGPRAGILCLSFPSPGYRVATHTGTISLTHLASSALHRPLEPPRPGYAYSLSRVRLLATPWTIAHQTPLSMGFSRQEYWSGMPFPLQGVFPPQGLNPGLPCYGWILYRLSHQGSWRGPRRVLKVSWRGPPSPARLPLRTWLIRMTKILE